MVGVDWLRARLDAPRETAASPDVIELDSETVADDDRNRRPASWSIADTLPLGIVFLDEVGTVRALNDAAAELLATGAEVVGQSVFGLLGGSADEYLGRYRAMLAGDVLTLDLAPRPDAPKTLRYVSVQLRALSGNEPAIGVAILEDRSTLETERARRRQAERLAALGEMAAGVAHEINNPLASIQTLAEQLTRETEKPAHRELLGVLAEEAARAATIVRRQLELSRDSRTRDSGPIDLNSVVCRVVDLRHYECRSHGVRIRLDLDEAISRAAGDEGDILQVVLNLVVNAEDALRDWDASDGRRIILRTRETSEGLVLAVVDNGPGISRDLLHRLFDPFFTTKSAGSGLGLALARSLVTDHGGALWVESQEDQGAAFTLRLPRAQESAPQVEERRDPSGQDGVEPEPHTPESVSRSVPPSDVCARPLRILVADDEPVLRLAIRRVLESRGHEVITFGKTPEALEYMTGHTVDAALIDAHMPGDGIAMVNQLEDSPETTGRVVLMSGDVRGMPAYECWRARGRFLSKPFSFDQLVDLVERVGAIHA